MTACANPTNTNFQAFYPGQAYKRSHVKGLLSVQLCNSEGQGHPGWMVTGPVKLLLASVNAPPTIAALGVSFKSVGKDRWFMISILWPPGSFCMKPQITLNLSYRAWDVSPV